MSKTVTRGITYAVRASQLSVGGSYYVGAALLRGRRLVSLGWNSPKTHPKSKTRFAGHHAEFAVLIGTRREDTEGLTLYVARRVATGLAMAKPCKDCQELILASGIKRVYYTDFDGNVQELVS